MDQFINSLPKTFVAIVVMVGALLLLRQVSPPRTVCDTQMELFQASQKSFLYPGAAVGNIRKASKAKQLTDVCKLDNSPGGCLELFDGLKRMSVDLKNIPDQCSEQVASDNQISSYLWGSLSLMVQIAWGDRAPASYSQRNGWFDTSEITVFCDLRGQAIRLYGQERFGVWQEEMLSGLPKADQLSREQIWQRNILSTQCDLFR